MRPTPSIFTGTAFLALFAGLSLSALAAGGMDPGYREVVSETERAVGRNVDWTVRIRGVQKRFYTYTLETDYLPPPGEGPCAACRVTIRYRSRPQETTRPARFKVGQVLAIRGTVPELAPHPIVQAAVVQAR